MQTIKAMNGVEIPMIGFGPGGIGYTPHPKIYKSLPARAWNKFVVRPKTARDYIKAVTNAFSLGYTLLDDSAAYNNYPQIVQAWKKAGLKREDLFITGRVSNLAQFDDRVEEEFYKSLEQLGTNYIDLYMFHWPVTELYLNTWKTLEKLYKAGKIRTIGVANCNIHHLQSIFDECDVKPMVNQFEVHPLFTQKELIKFCQDNGIVVEAYSPIARNDDRLVRLPKLKAIAAKYGKTVVQTILRWDIQNGCIPVIRSLNPKRQAEDIDIFDFELTEDEMKTIDSFNINARVRYDSDNCDFTIL